MDSTSENIGTVVALLTAVISEQENIAYEIVLETDPIELFSTFSGILLAAINTIARVNGGTAEDYLQQLARYAIHNQ